MTIPFRTTPRGAAAAARAARPRARGAAAAGVVL